MSIKTTPAQRKVIKHLKQGGAINVMPYRRHKYRLLDNRYNPIQFLHGKTFNALVRKQLLTKTESGGYIAAA